MNSRPPGDPIPLSPSGTDRPAQACPLSSSLPLPHTPSIPDFTPSPAMNPSDSIKNSNEDKAGEALFDQVYPAGSTYPTMIIEGWEEVVDAIPKIDGLPAIESTSNHNIYFDMAAGSSRDSSASVPETTTPENKNSADAVTPCEHVRRHQLSTGHWFCSSCYQYSANEQFWERYDEIMASVAWLKNAVAEAKSADEDSTFGKNKADAGASSLFEPWTYNEHDVDWGLIRDSDGFVTAIAKDKRVTQEEASKARIGKYDPYAKQGRLIAAAPEMLTALKDATVEVKRLALMLRDMDVSAKVQIDVVWAAEKAISKAEWGTP